MRRCYKYERAIDRLYDGLSNALTNFDDRGVRNCNIFPVFQASQLCMMAKQDLELSLSILFICQDWWWGYFQLCRLWSLPKNGSLLITEILFLLFFCTHIWFFFWQCQQHRSHWVWLFRIRCRLLSHVVLNLILIWSFGIWPWPAGSPAGNKRGGN